MKLKAIIPFSWAHAGVRIEHFPVGAIIETNDQDLVDVATAERWAEIDSGAATPVAPELPEEEAPAPEVPAVDLASDPPSEEVQEVTEVPVAPKRGRAKQQ